MPDVSVILLAAGESSRMGRQKALLPWLGSTLLEYHLAQFSSLDNVAEIIVVTGGEPDRITVIAGAAPRAKVVHNREYRSGKVSSITSGLTAVSQTSGAIMVIAVDQPRPSEILRQLLDGHSAQHSSITVPVRGGRRGHPVIFDRSLLPELMEISEDTKGVRAVMDRNRDDTHEVEIADDVVLLDLNVPSDLPERPA